MGFGEGVRSLVGGGGGLKAVGGRGGRGVSSTNERGRRGRGAFVSRVGMGGPRLGPVKGRGSSAGSS